MIRFDDTIVLLKQKVTKDDELNEIIEYEEREVFCNKTSITRSEFYNAASINLRPSIVFTINEFEYEDEEKLKYEGKIYSIIRTFKKTDYIELTVGDKIGDYN